MNTYSKIADGLAGWLTFELRCGREAMFSEAYLTQPLHQLLSNYFPGRVNAEVEHLVLAKNRKRRGKKPCVDFAIVSGDRTYAAFIETKWVSQSQTLLRDILRDVVRLDMLMPTHTKEAMLVLAGKACDIYKLFQTSQFQPHPQHLNSKHILPLENHTKSSVRFVPVPKFRQSLYTQVLKPFQGYDINRSIPLERSGPFPRGATTRHIQVYLWRLRKHGNRELFKPEEYYDIGNTKERI